MKIRTSVNLFLAFTLIIAICGALVSTIYYVRSYIEKTFYRNMYYLLDSSCSKLQRDLESGLMLSRSFANQENLIRWFESYEKNEQDGEDIRAMLLKLSNEEKFSTCFAASKLTGSYYVVDKNNIIRDKLSETDPADSWFYSLLKEKGDMFYNVDYNKTLGITNFWFDCKIFNSNRNFFTLCKHKFI